jgi:hypothetical protein
MANPLLKKRFVPGESAAAGYGGNKTARNGSKCGISDITHKTEDAQRLCSCSHPATPIGKLGMSQSSIS